MKKEEILEKSRKQGDEMVKIVRDNSMKWTYLAMALTTAIFAFIRAENGQPTMDLCVTICVSVAVGQIYRYIRIKEKCYLIFGIVAVCVAVFSLIRFIMGH